MGDAGDEIDLLRGECPGPAGGHQDQDEGEADQEQGAGTDVEVPPACRFRGGFERSPAVGDPR